MINSTELILKDIEDEYVRENFKRLSVFLASFPFFRGEWKFFELTFNGSVTNLKIPHGLTFTPKDVILTSSVGAGVVTFNYSLFNKNTIDISTSGACTIRCFIGSYKEESERTGR